MPSLKLTARSIEQLKATDRDTFYWDTEVTGFGLKITPAGRRSYIYQYRMGGRGTPVRKYTIGPMSHVAQARKIAEQLEADVTNGNDPVAARKAARLAITSYLIKDVAELFIERHVSQNRSHKETIRIINKEIIGVWGKRGIRTITKQDVNNLLNDIVDRGTKTMANRTFAAMRKMFKWAFSQDYILSSPCIGVTAPAKANKRDRVLTDDELTAIMQATQNVSSKPFNGIVQLLVYTAQRRTEVAQMQWDELDLDACQWTLPASRSKNGKSHIVHLSQPAIDVINSTPKLGTYVFTTHPRGEKPFQNYGHAKSTLDKSCKVTGWVLHDIRRTVVTGIANMRIPPHIADKLLNHQSGTISGVAAVYQRAEFLDERRDALHSWASYVTALLDEPDASATNENTRPQVKEQKTSNVIPLIRAVQR